MKALSLSGSQASWPPSAALLKCSLGHVAACRLNLAHRTLLSHLLLPWGGEKQQFGQYVQMALK